MGNSNSLEANKSIPTGKSRRNSRVKEKYFSRFGHKKSKDNIFRQNIDFSEINRNDNNGGSGEPDILSTTNNQNDKELPHGIEMSPRVDFDWSTTISYRDKINREGSADTDTARDALLLDETPSPCRDYHHQQANNDISMSLTSCNNSTSLQQSSSSNILKNEQQKSTTINVQTQNVADEDQFTTFIAQPQNVADADEDHLTTLSNNNNVNQVEHIKKKNGNSTIIAGDVVVDGSREGREPTNYYDDISNDLKSNEYGTIENKLLSPVIESNENNKNNHHLNIKLFNKYLTNKSESDYNCSGTNIVIVQTDSWNLVRNLQTNSINRQLNTDNNCDHLDTCEVIILKDSSSSSDSIFTDPLTPIGFTTQFNECYISEENICDDNNPLTTVKHLKSEAYLNNRAQYLLNEKLKKLSLSKVICLNVGNGSGDNNDSPEQDDLEMAIHLRNKLAQMLSSEEQKNCTNNIGSGGSGENGTIFNVSKAKKVELQNLSSRLPDNSITGQSTAKTSTNDNLATTSITPDFESSNQQPILTPSPSFFGSLTESNVLKKVATFITAEKSGNNGKSSDNQIASKRSSLIPEKLDFGTYEKFEGQMLMKWFTTSFQNSGYTLNEQELNALTQQYCTNLLTIGVIKQISEKSEMENFNPFQMYQWAHRESPSTSVPISPGRLVADIKWPHSSKTTSTPNKITKSTQSDFVRNKVDTENYLESLTSEFYQTSSPKLKSGGMGVADRKVYEIKKSLLNCSTLAELYEVIETLLPDRKPSTRLDQSTYYEADLNETEVTIYKLNNSEKNSSSKIIEKTVDIALQTSFNESVSCSKCENLRNNKTSIATSPAFKDTKNNKMELKETMNASTSTVSHISPTSISSTTTKTKSLTSAPPTPPPPPPPLMLPIFHQIKSDDNNVVVENLNTTTNIKPSGSPVKKSNGKTPSPPPCKKNTTPLIPTNAGPPPPPPPPSFSGPPPPPIPGSSNIVVPPPPPPVHSTTSNNSNGNQKSSDTNCPPPPGPLPMPMPDGGLWFQTNTLRKNAVNPPKPMKPLYWTRIVAPKPIIIEEKTDSSPEEEQQQPTKTTEVQEKPKQLWQEIEETNLDNIDEFTDLFSRQAIIPKNKPEKKKINQIKTIKILDSKRSQNVGIFSRSLHFHFEEIEHAVYHCDTSVVNLETLQHIMSIKATNEELSLIRDASTGDIPLDAPEQFLLRIAQISSSAERISCIVFQAEFDDGTIQLSRKLQVVKQLSLFLTDSDDLKLLFSIILTLGNYMNGGNRSRGQADGFGLEILGKLKDVKSKDSKITLLHFIVKTYIDRKRKLGTPLTELMLPIPDPSDVDKACAVDFDEVKQQISELNRKLKSCKVTTEKVVSLSTEENIQPFKDKMEEFIEMGTQKIDRQFNKLEDCRTIFLKTMRFYHFIPKSGTPEQCTPGQFYEYWLHFTNDFRDIWKKEITFLSNEFIKKMKSQHKIKKNGSTLSTTDNKPNKVKPGSLKDRILKMGKK